MVGAEWWRKGLGSTRLGEAWQPIPTPLSLATTLSSLVILPVLEGPPPRPVGSLAIGSLEALRLHCLQPFSTQDTRGQPFHAQAQEALDVLLRHPSGGAGQESGGLTCCSQDPSMRGT